jgi:GDP-L-fucose synthase
MEKQASIYIAGHNGMLGSAIVRTLKQAGYNNLIVAGSKELDLRNINQVKAFVEQNKPEYVILAAAKVGGINANMKYPVDFLQDNLMIQTNLISQAHANGVKKFVFIGSSCIYPKACPQPMKEEYLLDGKLEPTNEGYALAKITGFKLLEYYKTQYGFNSISLMPCNLYGPNDSFNLEHSHVLSALVKRFSDAKKTGQKDITLWGSGIAMREFMHVDDAAKAILYFMESYDGSEFINVGWGRDISIKELAEMISQKVGFEGNINWDTTKPDGMLRKCMDVSRMLAAGFQPDVTIKEGVQQMINIYQEQLNKDI